MGKELDTYSLVQRRQVFFIIFIKKIYCSLEYFKPSALTVLGTLCAFLHAHEAALTFNSLHEEW